MAKTYRRGSEEEGRYPKFLGDSEEFRCRHCKMMVGVPLSGGRNRNHCPFCLYSRHVDGRTPGDRASECGALMAPVGAFARIKGEHAILHRCLGCGFERHNRLAADDNFAAFEELPIVEPPLMQVEEL